MEELFSQIKKAINDDDAFSVRATYDDAYGCPATLYIDYDEAQVDEEYSLIIRDLVGVDQNCPDLEESPTTSPTLSLSEEEQESSAPSANNRLLYVVVLVVSSLQFIF